MSEVISVRVPKELKDKAVKYGINISKLVKETLKKEIEKKEIEEIKKKLDDKSDLLRDLAKEAPRLQRILRESR